MPCPVHLLRSTSTTLSVTATAPRLLDVRRNALDAVHEVAQQILGLPELDSSKPSKQLAEQVSQLDLGDLAAKAEMRSAAAETHVRVRRPGQVEPVRLVEDRFVTVGRAVEQPDLVACLEFLARELGVGRDEPGELHDGRRVSDELLDGGAD